MWYKEQKSFWIFNSISNKSSNCIEYTRISVERILNEIVRKFCSHTCSLGFFNLIFLSYFSVFLTIGILKSSNNKYTATVFIADPKFQGDLLTALPPLPLKLNFESLIASSADDLQSVVSTIDILKLVEDRLI
jgi:hypothetical protein